MNTHLDLLQGYQQLLKLSNAMLAQAKQGQWDDLIACEMTYLRSVESVARDQDISGFTSKQQMQIRPLLKQVLDNENELKGLLFGRMDELRSLVQTTTQQQKVTSAYGRLSGNILYPSDH
ncbi:flagella biosynthesis regulatory protein FliT [Pantoea sp. LMR881]|uniref:flagella biosynthesis regulatory protein FliT n=1 Tax=Pantoea sp. LMR881 TaxID=3014336 RepID=UPI0022AFA3D9|nr:flagella biosynthesis regulatory protein FliT [Pantoea sp. LMR881]MCZ4058144.1 flagella biosynthesis regulatory protein FliT [Pantoea sp. LMR881]